MVKATRKGRSRRARLSDETLEDLPLARCPQTQVSPATFAFSVAARSQVHWAAGRAPNLRWARQPNREDGDWGTYGSYILRRRLYSRWLLSHRYNSEHSACRTSRLLSKRRRRLGPSGRSMLMGVLGPLLIMEGLRRWTILLISVELLCWSCCWSKSSEQKRVRGMEWWESDGSKQSDL